MKHYYFLLLISFPIFSLDVTVSRNPLAVKKKDVAISLDSSFCLDVTIFKKRLLTEKEIRALGKLPIITDENFEKEINNLSRLNDLLNKVLDNIESTISYMNVCQVLLDQALEQNNTTVQETLSKELLMNRRHLMMADKFKDNLYLMYTILDKNLKYYEKKKQKELFYQTLAQIEFKFTPFNKEQVPNSSVLVK